MQNEYPREDGYQNETISSHRSDLLCEVISKVGESFASNAPTSSQSEEFPSIKGPLDITVEAGLQYELLNHFRDQFDYERVPVRGGYLGGEPAKYKEPYLKRLCQPSKIPKVLPEVNVSVSSKFASFINDDTEKSLLLIEDGAGQASYRNASVDLAILEPPGPHPLFSQLKIPDSESNWESNPAENEGEIQIAFAAGSKYFPPSALSHAIELKYFKDIATPGSELSKNADKFDEFIEDDELGEKLEEYMWRKIDTDMEKLYRLANNHGVESHLVIFSNFNIFRTTEACDEDAQKEPDLGAERLSTLSRVCDAANIHLWEYHSDPKEQE